MNSIFIEDQQKMSEQSRISESAELEETQWEEAQQVEILSLDNNVTENSSDENNKNLNLIDNKNIDENSSQLSTTIRSDQTVRFIKKMWQSKTQEAEQKRKKTVVQEIADMILEYTMIAKKAGQHENY